MSDINYADRYGYLKGILWNIKNVMDKQTDRKYIVNEVSKQLKRVEEEFGEGFWKFGEGLK